MLASHCPFRWRYYLQLLQGVPRQSINIAIPFLAKNLTWILLVSTQYAYSQFVILPQSKNNILLLGKIIKLLCCKSNYGYLLCQNMSTEYCQNSDLFFLEEWAKIIICSLLQNILLFDQNFVNIDVYDIFYLFIF